MGKGKAKATPKQSGPKSAASEQLEGSLQHQAHLRAQTIERLGTQHGTDKSQRGVRKRRNPMVPPLPKASGGVTKGGRYR